LNFVFFFQAEDGIRDRNVTGVQTCALPIWVGVGLVVRRDDQGSRRRDVLDADQLETEVGAAERVEPGTEEVQDGCVHALAYTQRSEERRVGKECRSRSGTYE